MVIILLTRVILFLASDTVSVTSKVENDEEVIEETDLSMI